MSFSIVILAAGQGTRMNSDRPKVLHEVAGAPLIHHAMLSAAALEPARTVIVAGHGELVTPEGTVPLEPGTAVFIPIGLHHQSVSHGPGNLEMVTSFGPPVVPGSYEADED